MLTRSSQRIFNSMRYTGICMYIICTLFILVTVYYLFLIIYICILFVPGQNKRTGIAKYLPNDCGTLCNYAQLNIHSIIQQGKYPNICKYIWGKYINNYWENISYRNRYHPCRISIHGQFCDEVRQKFTMLIMIDKLNCLI